MIDKIIGGLTFSIHFVCLEKFNKYYFRKLQVLHIGPNPISSFQEDFLPNLLLSDISLKNISMKIIPATIAYLVIFK